MLWLLPIYEMGGQDCTTQVCTSSTKNRGHEICLAKGGEKQSWERNGKILVPQAWLMNEIVIHKRGERSFTHRAIHMWIHFMCLYDVVKAPLLGNAEQNCKGPQHTKRIFNEQLPLLFCLLRCQTSSPRIRNETLKSTKLRIWTVYYI